VPNSRGSEFWLLDASLFAPHLGASDMTTVPEGLAAALADRDRIERELGAGDYGLTVAGLAEAVGVARQSINELLRGRRAVSPEMALRLSRLFGNSPEFWLNAQQAVDLWDAGQAIKDEMARIKPLRVA
jgi:addiction module HigA family antidote